MELARVRISRGRNEKISFVIVDAQSVKNTDPAEQKGYMRGRRYLASNAIVP